MGTVAPDIHVACFNPWEPSATLQTTIGTEGVVGTPGMPGVTGDSLSGLIAVCVPVDTSTPEMSRTEILVYLLGPRLEPLGTLARVGTLSPRMPADTACEVGLSSSGILVAWWSRTETEVWVRPLAPAAR